MNGRIYDSALGRFLQADPIIQEPNNPQNFNRYTYVLNNPLSLTDPSGFLFKGFGKFFRSALSIGVLFIPLPGLNVFLAAALRGFVSGLIQSGSLKGGLRGAFSNVVGARLGVGNSEGGSSIGAGLTNRLRSGILESLRDGNAGHDFVAVGTGFETAARDRTLGGGFIALLGGGTSSAQTGGKFANGAVSESFEELFGKGATRKFTRENASRRATAALRLARKFEEITSSLPPFRSVSAAVEGFLRLTLEPTRALGLEFGADIVRDSGGGFRLEGFVASDNFDPETFVGTNPPGAGFPVRQNLVGFVHTHPDTSIGLSGLDLAIAARRPSPIHAFVGNLNGQIFSFDADKFNAAGQPSIDEVVFPNQEDFQFDR